MGLVGSIASALHPREDRLVTKGGLAELDRHGSLILESYRSFQYFPETIHDSRGVDWSPKQTIGGSHPIYQWVHGSGREISFDVIFTRDAASVQPEPGILGLASDILNNPLSAAVAGAKSLIGGPLSAVSDYTVKIEAAIAWLRSKTYPTYSTHGGAVKPPPKLLLILPNSGIMSGTKKLENTMDLVPVVMTRCDVAYESFFRRGEPRIVTVSLGFIEIIQVGAQGWGYVDRDDINGGWGYATEDGLPNKKTSESTLQLDASEGYNQLSGSGQTGGREIGKTTEADKLAGLDRFIGSPFINK